MHAHICCPRQLFSTYLLQRTGQSHQPTPYLKSSIQAYTRWPWASATKAYKVHCHYLRLHAEGWILIVWAASTLSRLLIRRILSFWNLSIVVFSVIVVNSLTIVLRYAFSLCLLVSRFSILWGLPQRWRFCCRHRDRLLLKANPLDRLIDLIVFTNSCGTVAGWQRWLLEYYIAQQFSLVDSDFMRNENLEGSAFPNG